MSASKSTGIANKVAGVIKETTGKVVSSDLEARGAAQKNQGQTELDAAKLQNRGEAAVNKTSGVEETLGNVTGSKGLQRSGKAKRQRGAATDASNQF
jgi:uncharacterized protein YjbJ (UPF0337 family)